MSSKVYEGLMQKLATVLDVMDELNANQTSVEIRRKLVQTASIATWSLVPEFVVDDGIDKHF